MFNMESPTVQRFNVKADNVLSSVNGLVGEYYTFPSTDTKFSFQTLKARTIDANVNTADFTGKLSTMTGQPTYDAVRWTGQIQAQATGSTVFNYYGDNGVRLWINGQLILDHWVNTWNVNYKSRPVDLVAGRKYDFKMEYFQAAGGANISLSWSTPSFTQREIHSSCFFLPDDYTGAVITGLDISNANLTCHGISGIIGILGKGLAGSKVEIVDGQGAELTPPLYCTPLSSSTNDELVVNVPSNLTTGLYIFILSNGVYKFWYHFNVGKDFGDNIPRSEYPRPDWQRDQWMNLNGKWDFDFDPQALGDAQSWQAGHAYSKTINVPYPWESSLSGVCDPNYLGVAWYRRSFSLNDSWAGKQVILNFGAVDWRCKIWINGTLAGTHEGGYSQFDLNITKMINVGAGTSNTIVVRAEDYDQSNSAPSQNDQLVGKQGHDTPAGYTHSSGIWQTVYLTAQNSETYIKSVQANPDIAGSSVTFNIKVSNAAAAGKVYTLQYAFNGALNDQPNGSNFSGKWDIVLAKTGDNPFALMAKIPDQRLWDAENPNLYNGKFQLYDGDTLVDSVSTYFGQREVGKSAHSSNDYQYVDLNGKPVFLSGALLQGFWQDGIYTAPEASSYLDDIRAMKTRGFNMLRMHIKIEDPLFYYYADKTGMMIWQDMPWGPNFNKDDAKPDIGRASYENCLNAEMARDYNHPSIISIILFNENWGIHQIADTQKWMTSLYNDVKATHPGMLVEDMTGFDHIQPTDFVDFHEYEHSVSGLESMLSGMNTSLATNSQYMFQTNDKSFVYQGEPWFNGEYGGVGCGDGDKDVSWCYKYQTSIMRLCQRLNGFVYTEPYDIEFEHNGVLNYNRTPKTFGYDEAAYGGDMSMTDLNQPNFIGFYNDPVVTLKPGETFTARLGAVNWSGNTYFNLKIKWRFDATDAYGNNVSTGLSGEIPLDYTPYTMVNKTFSFQIPAGIHTSKLVGTVTAWIEEANGSKIAKNFTNIIVSDNTVTPSVEQIGDNAYALRQQPVTAADGSAAYTYPIPNFMDVSALRSVRVISELSSVKPGASQTSGSEQAPSDVTVSVNGHEIATVTVPDDPRDIRGTLSLSNDKPSATDFGYLLNLNIPDSVVGQLKTELASLKNLTVTYAIKDNAGNNHGLQFYGETSGRYAVTPMVVLNAPDQTADDLTGNGSLQTLSDIASASNYSVEADVTAAGSSCDTAGLAARTDGRNGYAASVSGDGTAVTLAKLDGTVIKQAAGLSLGSTAHLKMTLFDAHIRVYADNGVVPVIDVYDSSYASGRTGVIDSTAGSRFGNITVSPETYNVAALNVGNGCC